MDERIRPSARSGAGANSGENQATAASLGFSRFKTIENVKQRLEEQERLNKEKEALAAQEKRQLEEQAAAQQKHLQQQNKQKEAQEMQARQRQMLMQQQKHAQQVAAHAQAQAHHQNELIKQMNAQQNMMQNAHQMPNSVQGQQNGFQGATSIGAQQTPLMANSSPMVGQNGYPMDPTSSQGAGSPARPASAVLNQPNGVVMSRGASQQTHNSLHNTPHIQQNGTPGLANAVPNRSMNQTPHLNPSSPMVGTPTANMPMANARLNGNLDAAQQNLLIQQMQQHNQQHGNGQNMGNGQANVSGGGTNMSPEQFQIARQMSRLSEIAKSSHAQAQQAASQGNQALASQHLQRAGQAQQQYQNLRGRFLGSQQNNSNNSNNNIGNAQGTPIGNHAHPTGGNNNMPQSNGNIGGQHQTNNVALMNHQAQQMAMQHSQAGLTPQQQSLIRGQHELRRLLQQHNGNIPPQIVAQLPQPMQMLLRQHQQRQQHQLQAQARGQVQSRMGMPMPNQGSPPNQSHQNTQYMQNMRALQNGLAMQMQGQQANGQDVNGNMGMNMANMPQFAGNREQGQQQNNGGGDLSQSFAAMHDALSRGHGVP